MDLLLPHLGLIVWTLLAFLIVFFILKKFAWKQIIGGLQERESNIADAIATAEKVKNEMAQLKSDNEGNLKKCAGRIFEFGGGGFVSVLLAKEIMNIVISIMRHNNFFVLCY